MAAAWSSVQSDICFASGSLHSSQFNVHLSSLYYTFLFREPATSGSVREYDTSFMSFAGWIFFFLIAAISIRSHRIRLIALRPLAILRLSPQLSAQSEHFRCTASCAHLIVAVRFIPWWTNQMTIPPLRSQVLISVRLCHGVCFFHSL